MNLKGFVIVGWGDSSPAGAELLPIVRPKDIPIVVLHAVFLSSIRHVGRRVKGIPIRG